MSYSLEALQYGDLLELVSRHAQTEMGEDRIAKVRPFTRPAELVRSLAAVAETIVLNEQKQVTWSFSGLSDPTDAVAILKIRNASLEPNIMQAVASLCAQALMARSAVKPEFETAPTIWQILEHIPATLLSVIDNINKKLLPGGEVDDSASPELARIRREITAQRSRLSQSLEAVMRKSGDAIQDAIVTIRNDRFVIPVKADFRGKVGGVAHGFSSSGATVFVEPLEAIEANNELQNLKGKEEREVARIIFELTESLREHLPAIEMCADAVAELDSVKAKIEFARKFNAIVPDISDDETLELIDARHPLLEENLRQKNALRPADDVREIVPGSFTLTKQRSVMIISGANAGGKTVVLKTAGLLSLMAISGLPVPAAAAKVPFYRSVLADIGDHQSLSADLSTFSSHMSNIAAMMDECQPPSLVLLDEVGTGTDPEEGSALGVAIVDHFRRKCGAQVITSTHYRGLKIYAANDPDVINASVEFDEKTLQPTYKLLIGLAGASSGIEIARRFGILPSVIDAARGNLDISAREAENYLSKLQTETKHASDLRTALEEEREAVAMKYAKLDIEAGKKEKERQREFEQELARTLDDFDRQSSAFIRSIEDKALRSRLETERSARKAEMNRAVLSKVQRPKASGFSVRHVEQAVPEEGPIIVGTRVITSFGNVGMVEKLDRETAEVVVGAMRLREKVSDLRRVANDPKPAERTGKKLQNQAKGSNVRLDTEDAAAELNLIGKTTAEAEYEIDRFLDEAYLGSLPSVRIIHGFGTGALKNYVHHVLKNHDLVETFAFAPQSEGGNGATIAKIKMN